LKLQSDQAVKTYPSISIAIPTFNEQRNVIRCLDSIFNQHYGGKLEVFIIDGGSTDATLQLANKYPVQILHNPYKQAEYGKKIGLMKATGDYFMILDCDMDLVGDKWFESMVEPLEEDQSIVGSWAKFVSARNDAVLDKYITLDPIQRDPLFTYLTASINGCLKKKEKNYWIMEYTKFKMLPAGFCLFRRKQILSTLIRKMKKYMELDNLVILLNKGYSRYAYVQTIGLHHPFLTTLRNLARKRIRNINTMYFNQPDKRYWTWINWDNGQDRWRIFLWLLYVYLIIPSVIVSLIKTIRYRTFVGMFELPVNIVCTSAILYNFLRQSEGRLLLKRFIGKT
jgi:glycosyltransferase involved in cell wall biosynthesis